MDKQEWAALVAACPLTVELDLSGNVLFSGQSGSSLPAALGRCSRLPCLLLAGSGLGSQGALLLAESIGDVWRCGRWT